MVKGVSRQVIVVRPPDTKLFEQAIFLLRDGADGGISDEALLRQARQAAGQYLQASRTPRRRLACKTSPGASRRRRHRLACCSPFSEAKPPVTTGGFTRWDHAMIAENYTVPVLQISRVTGILSLDNYPDM